MPDAINTLQTGAPVGATGLGGPVPEANVTFSVASVLPNLVPGIKTSEFWMGLVLTLSATLAKLNILCDHLSNSCSPGAFTDQDFAIVMGAVVVYGMGRFFLKSQHITVADAVNKAVAATQTK